MGSGHDVDRARVDRADFIAPPVAHMNVDLVEGRADIIAIDPVDHIEAFAGAPIIHGQFADIAGAAQKAKCIRHDRCGRYSGGRESAQQRAPRKR